MKKIFAFLLTLSLVILCAAAAFAEGGFFGWLAGSEYADERMALLEEVSEPVGAKLVTKAGIPVEIGQAYYEGNRVFVSYKIGANTDVIELFEGAPEGIEWEGTEENWILAEIPAYYPDTKKENEWLDGKGQRWLKSPWCHVMDGIELEDGGYADIFAGDEARMEDGSVIGWKECVIPEESIADTLTFRLEFISAVAVRFQDGSTFKENYGEPETESVTFTLRRKDSVCRLAGETRAEQMKAGAELVMGSVDMTGEVRIISAEQAASWNAFFNDEEDESGTDVIVMWNLYRNGEMVSYDLDNSNWTEGDEEIVFKVRYPALEDLSGLTLVPEYGAAGEKPEEAIPLKVTE